LQLFESLIRSHHDGILITYGENILFHNTKVKKIFTQAGGQGSSSSGEISNQKSEGPFSKDMNSLVDRDAMNRMEQEVHHHHPDGCGGIQEVVKNSKEQIIEYMQRSKLNAS
jgi:hypothetical protein